jgi:anti-anti-sigma factor
MVPTDRGATVGSRDDRRRGRLWRLSVTCSRSESHAILLLEGRLGHSTASELKAAAGPLVAEGVSNLVLDLSRVDYLSSAALQILERLSLDLEVQGGRLTLRAPADPVRVALELFGALTAAIESTPE